MELSQQDYSCAILPGVSSTCLQSLKIARASRAAWNLSANVIMPHGPSDAAKGSR